VSLLDLHFACSCVPFVITSTKRILVGVATSQERYLLEHWYFSYSPKTAAIPPNISVVYAKFVMLFRSIYLYLKILPAYEVFESATAVMATSRLSYQITPSALTLQHPFGHTTKPERVEFGRIETAFGNMELVLQYRKDVSFALSERPEVIPDESIIPDYAPSLSSKIPIRPPSSKVGTSFSRLKLQEWIVM
jgi:hypothetical protein